MSKLKGLVLKHTVMFIVLSSLQIRWADDIKDMAGEQWKRVASDIELRGVI